MDFSKVVHLLALTVLLVVNDSTQFLVADCVWDEALAEAPIGDLKGFVLSDADACSLFCAKPNANGGVLPASPDTQGAMSPSNAALCDRCCKSSQPPSKPGELLVTILQTLIKAFGPSKDSPAQTIATGAIPAGKPAGGGIAPSQPPPAETPEPVDAGPTFDPGETDTGTVNLGENRKSRPAEVVEDFNKRAFLSRAGRLQSDPRRDRPYPEPEARIYEIPGGSDDPAPGHAFSDDFGRAADRGASWPNLSANFPRKSGPIR